MNQATHRETLQAGVHLYFYCHVRARHEGLLVSEWLLQRAQKLGIGGGSVFRATSGYGRHGIVREERFFELTDDLPVKIEFLLLEAQAERLLAEVRASGVSVVYARSPAWFAELGDA